MIGSYGPHADLPAARPARVVIGDRDGEPLIAHHEDGYAFFAERVVDVVGRVAAHPRNAFGLERARETIRRFNFHRCLLALFALQAVAGLGPRRPRRVSNLSALQAVAGLGRRRPRRVSKCSRFGALSYRADACRVKDLPGAGRRWYRAPEQEAAWRP